MAKSKEGIGFKKPTFIKKPTIKRKISPSKKVPMKTAIYP